MKIKLDKWQEKLLEKLKKGPIRVNRREGLNHYIRAKLLQNSIKNDKT